MHIIRSNVLPSESFLREILNVPSTPAAIVVVGESDAHRQATIDLFEQTLSSGFDVRWQAVKLQPNTPVNQLDLVFADDAAFRFVNVDGVHSGQLEARQTIVQRVLGSGAMTVVMIWVDFNAGDPLPDWFHFSSFSAQAQAQDSEPAAAERIDDTRTFKWDPSIPACRPAEDEADFFYRLRP